MLDYLTLFLILSPIELPPPTNHPAAIDSLRSFNLAAELDNSPRSRYGRYEDELRWTRLHLWVMAGYPSLLDCSRLPDYVTACSYRDMAERYRDGLENRRAIRKYEWDVLTELMEDAGRRRDIWGLIADAQRIEGSWAGRRGALQRLREVVGYPVYYTGRWPVPVP